MVYVERSTFGMHALAIKYSLPYSLLAWGYVNLLNISMLLLA